MSWGSELKLIKNINQSATHFKLTYTQWLTSMHSIALLKYDSVDRLIIKIKFAQMCTEHVIHIAGINFHFCNYYIFLMLS